MPIEKKTKTGIGRLWNAFHFSMDGLKATFKHEEAFRQEVLLVLILSPLALWLGQTGIERAVLMATLLLVLMVELLNSAVESVVDRFGKEYHALSKRAKDIASAAVLLSLVNMFICWLLILCPRFC
jgi:diacylglycerol kinase (ATP)